MANDATRTVGEVGEFDLLERLTRRLAPASDALVALGIGDDCAALPARLAADGEVWLVSTDLLVEDVHFRRDWSSGEEVGWKALAANLSDLAAMGGTPVCATIGLSLPAALPVSWIEAVYDGANALTREHEVAIVGGDVTRSPQGVTLAITVLGHCRRDHLLTRSGGRPGDLLVVTGTLGEAAAGLALLRQRPDLADSPKWSQQVRAHLRPVPRVAAAQAVAATGGVTAALDLSDGLAGDLQHVCRQSGVGAEVEVEALPLSAGVREAARELHADPVEWALRGGEDYELLLAARPEQEEVVLAALENTGLRATVVGRLTDSAHGLLVKDAGGTCRPLGAAFDHFA